jgi:hypothetical protein
MDLGVMDWGVALVGMTVAITAALVVMRIVRRIVSGCVSTGLGCLVLIIGLGAVAAFLTTELGITRVQDLMDLLLGILR